MYDQAEAVASATLVEGKRGASPIGEGRAHLDHAVSVLDKTVAELAMRLAPVLGPEFERDAPSGPHGLREPHSELANCFHDYADVVANITERLHDVLARLEV